ncbi:MAG: hypothetical protein JRC68_09920 [Deltaproteobacteria bacterium]|nr:hypothetical protein [Deltaproteobacteria bacterium]
MALDSDVQDYVDKKVKEIADSTTKIVGELKDIIEKVKVPANEDFVKTTERLAKISKRREEVKEKLEAGQLKVDEAADLGIEYRALNKAYEDLLEKLR